MRALKRVVSSCALVCLTAAVALAQQTTTTETKKFTVISVEGNQLVVRLPEGTREMTVPDDFRFNVDGKMLSVRELRAGMSGTATVTTRTTVVPVTVTEVKNGTVVQASGGSVLIQTSEGYRNFTQGDVDKRGVRIMRDGKPVLISDLRANDRLSAVIITSKPPQILTEKEVQATLAKTAPATGAKPAATPPPAAAPPTRTAPPPPPPAGGAAAPAPAPKKLPKTASPLPLLGLAGLVSLVAGLGLTVRRRRAAR